jgi:AcrR family transcriptional regulator
MGLRERQKADRSERILDAAMRLFREDGVEATHVEAIAGLADVAPGTVYNYFPTKGDLLVGIVTREVTEVVAAGAAVVADPPGDVTLALTRLIDSYYDHSQVYLSKEMWRAAMAQTIVAPDAPASRDYVALDAQLAGQMTALIAALQARGRVRADADAGAIGQMLFHHLDARFRDFVRSGQTLDGLKADMAAGTRALARLIAA